MKRIVPMRAAILGARGQLGQELARVLPGAVIPLGRPEVDLAHPETLDAVLAAHRPDVVFNCAAYNFVDRAEDEPREAFTVNALGVRELARRCEARGCVLVHFSTDYVFGLDERRRAPYTEADAPGPVSVYGGSKLAGEHFVPALCPRHFVVRTCGLYGTRGQGGKGGNFVEAILRRAAEGKPLRVIDDQECTPTAAADLARAALGLVGTEAYGLYHLTNAGACTWFAMARRAVELAGLSADVAAVSSADYGLKARRPRYSVLDCARYQALGLPPMRPWDEALWDYVAARG
jgi:dTDP-4-dehydrorhamnose reductase